MATLADYPRPAHPEREGITRYEDNPRNRLSNLDWELERTLKEANKFLFEWRAQRNKKLSLGDKLFRGSKWKKLHVDEGEILGALGTPFKKSNTTGCHYLSKHGWFDGDGISALPSFVIPR